jgi:hypothetical protein
MLAVMRNDRRYFVPSGGGRTLRVLASPDYRRRPFGRSAQTGRRVFNPAV